MERARHWNGIFEVLIRRADEMEKPAINVLSNNSVISVADELGKLVNLRDSGVLTHEEFSEQKSRILANNIDKSKLASD